MKPTVRCGLVLAAVLIASASGFPIAAAHPAGLTVHEWGTFTSVAGEDGSPMEWDALGCKDDLPAFVNDFGYRGFKWRLQGTVRMETPVLYFYSPREIEAHVSVAFPLGLITEWYPQAEYEVFQTSRATGSLRRLEGNLNGIDTSLRSVTGAIEWSHIKVQPDTEPALPTEQGSSRYYAARETDAAPIAVGGQHEKFLFYRGVGRFPIPLSARLSADGKVLVENRGHEAVPTVILFENRGGRLGYRNGGAVESTMTLDPPSLDVRQGSPDGLSLLRYDLETALVEQGLFLREAQAMVETWRDSWFEEGSRLIYVLPSRSVDAILPLRIEPLPSRTARVFVGRIELVTPDSIRSVEDALANGDGSAIERYRRFLGPILRRAEPGNLDRLNQVERLLQQRSKSISAERCP
jgi:hypothetical protein